MKNNKKLIIWISLFLLALPITFAQTHNIIIGGNKLDNTITISNVSGYDYMMDNGNYGVYFKNNSKDSNAIKFIKDGYAFEFDISTSQVKWYNSSLNAEIGMVQEMNPQDNSITPSENIGLYPTAWINTDLSYSLSDNQIKEILTITNVPSTSSSIGADYLQYRSNNYFNNSLQVCYNNGTADLCQLHPTNWKFTTQGKIEFKDADNDTIFYIPSPKVWDASGNMANATYGVTVNNGVILVNIRIPTSFIDDVTYPLYIDPTISLTGGDLLADVYWRDFDAHEYEAGYELWNISLIPASQIINEAKLCLYITMLETSSSSISYINNQVWDETIADTTTLGAMLNLTLGTFDPATENAYNCIDVTTQVQASYSNGNENMTIALNGTKFPSVAPGNVYNGATFRWCGVDVVRCVAEDREGSGGTTNYPYLNITYSEAGGGSDEIPPTYSAVISNNTAPRVSENITLNTTWLDETALSDWIFWTNQSGEPGTNLTSSTTWVVTTEGNISETSVGLTLAPGETIAWEFFANDTSNNWNGTGRQTVTLTDQAPTYSNQVANNTSPHRYDDITLNATWSEDGVLAGWILTHNATDGNLVNETFNTTFGSNNESTFVITTNLTVGRIFEYGFWANDTNGNENWTGLASITITDTLPTVTLTSPTDSDRTNDNTTDFEFTYTDADEALGNCILYINISSPNPDENYSGNASIPSGVSNTFSIDNGSELSDGDYLWNINCTDGTTLINSSWFTFTIDTIAPIIWTNLYPSSSNTTIVNDSITWDANCTDVNGGLFAALLNVSNSTDGNLIFINDTNLIGTLYQWDMTNSTAALGGGNYTVILSCSDDHTDAGYADLKKEKKGVSTLVFNESDTIGVEMTALFIEKDEKDTDIPGNFDYWVDDDGIRYKFGYNFTVLKPETKLVINITSYDDSIIYREPVSGIKGHFIFGDKFYIDFASVPDNMTVNVTQVTVSNYLVRIEGKDIQWAGNEYVFIDPEVGGLNTIEESFDINIDHESPTFSNNLSNATSSYVFNDVELNITVADDQGIDCVKISHNNTGDFINSSCINTEGGTNVTTGLAVTGIQQKGDLAWKIWANDTAGFEDQSITYAARILNSPVSINGTIDPLSANTSGTFTFFDFNASDEDPGETLIWSTNNTILSINPDGILTATPEEWQNGTHTINISVNDNDDSFANYTLDYTVFDVLAPRITVIIPYEGQIMAGNNDLLITVEDSNNDTTSVVVTVGNNTGNFTVDNSGTGWSSMNTITGDSDFNATVITTNFTDGNYKICFNATDLLLNSNVTCANITFDNRPPQISYTSNSFRNNTIYTDSFILINVSVSDAIKINTTILEINGVNESFMFNTSTLWWTNKSVSRGYYLVRAFAIDMAGNINWTEHRNITISPNVTAPMIILINTTPDPPKFLNALEIYANITTGDSSTVSANISITSPNGTEVDNVQMSNITDIGYWNYSFIFNVSGTWWVNITAQDEENDYDIQRRSWEITDAVSYSPSEYTVTPDPSNQTQEFNLSIWHDSTETYNFNLTGFMENDTCFEIIFDNSSVSVGTSSITSPETVSITIYNNCSNEDIDNGQYYGNITINRSAEGIDNQFWEIPIELGINPPSGMIEAVNISGELCSGGSCDWGTSMFDSQTYTNLFYFNNTGNYTLSNCIPSVVDYTSDLSNFTSFDVTDFNITIGTQYALAVTISNPNVDKYTSLIEVRCSATALGFPNALSKNPDNQPMLNISVQQAAGAGGGSGFSSVKSVIEPEMPPPEEQVQEICGDELCQDWEDPWNCKQDCFPRLGTLSCLRGPQCTWKQMWTTRLIIYILIIITIVLLYRRSKEIWTSKKS